MDELTILYDNRSAVPDLLHGWGFSCILDGRLLFDTGEKGDRLLSNMKTLEMDPRALEMVVISHDHWDHWGGLWELLALRPGLPVLIPRGASEELAGEIRKAGGEVMAGSGFRELFPGVYLSESREGRHRQGPIFEQALYVLGAGGLTVITGCAHPGAEVFIRDAVERFPGQKKNAVLGGFHFIGKDRPAVEEELRKLAGTGFRRIFPTHCSGNLAAELTETAVGTGWTFRF